MTDWKLSRLFFRPTTFLPIRYFRYFIIFKSQSAFFWHRGSMWGGKMTKDDIIGHNDLGPNSDVNLITKYWTCGRKWYHWNFHKECEKPNNNTNALDPPIAVVWPTHTHTNTQTHTHTHPHTYTHIDPHTYTHIQTQTQTHSHKDTYTLFYKDQQISKGQITRKKWQRFKSREIFLMIY